MREERVGGFEKKGAGREELAKGLRIPTTSGRGLGCLGFRAV